MSALLPAVMLRARLSGIALDRAGRQSGARRGRSALCAAFGGLLGLLPFAVAAQTTEPLSPVPSAPSGPTLPLAPGQLGTYAGQTVTTRPRPDFDPLGAQIGDFFWFPRAEVDEQFNSNIFALPSPTSDWITVLQPGFDLLQDSPAGTPSINLHASAAAQFYAQNPTQNTASGLVATDFRLPVDAGSAFYGNAGVSHSYIPRYSPNSPGNAAEPVTFNTWTASVGYAQTALRFGYEADLAVAETQYNAVPLFGGGVLPQSSGDTITPQATLRVSYEFIPDYLGYIRVSGTFFDYTHPPLTGTNLDSTAYRVDAGLQILPRHLIYGEVYAGYLVQVFSAPGLPLTTNADFGGRLTWNITPLTTMTFNGLRTPETTTTGNDIGVGYLATSVTASVDHELHYNLLLNATAGLENDSFQSITRTDNVLTAGASLRYLLNRNLYLGAAYTYQQRSSNVAGVSYSQSIVMLRLSTQF
jgi:hypothetical protein